jgi:hypothetical protein
VVVLASANASKKLKKDPVWITGIGWASDAPSLETREWGKSLYAEIAGKMAFKMAGIKNPRKSIDFLEIETIRNSMVGSLPYGMRKRVELATPYRILR